MRLRGMTPLDTEFTPIKRMTTTPLLQNEAGVDNDDSDIDLSPKNNSKTSTLSVAIIKE